MNKNRRRSNELFFPQNITRVAALFMNSQTNPIKLEAMYFYNCQQDLLPKEIVKGAHIESEADINLRFVSWNAV